MNSHAIDGQLTILIISIRRSGRETLLRTQSGELAFSLGSSGGRYIEDPEDDCYNSLFSIHFFSDKKTNQKKSPAEKTKPSGSAHAPGKNLKLAHLSAAFKQ